ncbi:MAG: type II secretion system F family protein [Bifidobacteriaceae bacterium]|jgi:pilus assembly protein TadC|nr:type II secretion system F family protein [Bifidobacteriaceae bacterium]
METILFLTLSIYVFLTNANYKRKFLFQGPQNQFKGLYNNKNIFARHIFDTGLILQLILAALKSGISIPRSLEIIGKAMENKTGDELKTISKKLKLGLPWTLAWKNTSARFNPIINSLEDAWNNGSSPESIINLKIEQLRKDKLYRAKTAGEQLGVKIVIPLGLCFLPSFIFIGILPVIISLVGNLF